ncbi:histidine kinase [Dactylosporangium sp. NPDC051484]|uniref:sensor histidine kinase n=1 Tax=Dactylosporangium sp. NPDC051484 TaxID=3154942 RepID=UPI00344C6042
MRLGAGSRAERSAATHPWLPAMWKIVIVGLAAACVVVGSLVAAIPQAEFQHRVRPFDLSAGAVVVAAVMLTGLLRWRSPVRALAAAVVMVNGYLLAGYPYGPVQLCAVVAIYDVARRSPLRVSVPTCGAAALVTAVIGYVRLTHDIDLPWLLALAWMGWLVAPWSVGTLVQNMAANRERQRRHLIARGAIEERMKLAAEVHDVAGHGFALVSMQAGVALLTFDEKPEQARRSLEAIQTTSAKSLAALRGMLDTFHDDTSPEHGAESPRPAALAPADDRVGLAGVFELVDQVRSSGLPVILQIRDIERTPSVRTGGVAYRVVQESLTNVLRHAGRTVARVSIRQSQEFLVVRVDDQGRGSPAEPEAGRGLAGMRHRVEAVGGRFTAGSRDGSGFWVEACIPMWERSS